MANVGLLGSKLAPFSIEQNHKLSKAMGLPLTHPDSYRRLVGRLIYFTHTWSDLPYSVQVLSQFMHQPVQNHSDPALRIHHYLKGTPSMEILLYVDSSSQLHTFWDFDWASCSIT